MAAICKKVKSDTPQPRFVAKSFLVVIFLTGVKGHEHMHSSSVDVLWDRTMPRFLVRNAGPQSQDSGCTASLPPQPLLRAQGPGNASGDRDRAVVSGQRPPDAHPKPGRPGPSWVEFVGEASSECSVQSACWRTESREPIVGSATTNPGNFAEMEGRMQAH